jgi:molybdopterin converting factor small subunit
MKVRIVVSGRDYTLAKALPPHLSLPEHASLGQALEAITGLLPEAKALPGTCLVAVSGMHVGTVRSHQDRPLRDGDELLILAPVAGG